MDSSPPASCKRSVARSKVPALQAEQLYSLAEVSRLFLLPPERLSALAMEGKFPAAAVIVPGGGHKGRRWSASQLNECLRSWANPLAEPEDHRPTHGTETTAREDRSRQISSIRFPPNAHPLSPLNRTAPGVATNSNAVGGSGAGS